MQHDQDIIANIRRGDKQAYRLLVERYQQKVFQTCMGFVHHEEDAADLTQEVFIKVYEKLDAFRGKAAFSTWLYRMAVNHSLNAVRKNKLKAYFRGNDGSDVPDRVDEDQEADGQLRQKEDRALLRKALGTLPASQRKAFVLSYYQDLSNQEVAEVLQLKLKAVESLLYRARQNMKSALIRMSDEKG